MNTVPKTQPLRAPGEPVRNMLITALYKDNQGWWIENWQKGQELFTVKWKQATPLCWDFVFANGSKETTECYCRR